MENGLQTLLITAGSIGFIHTLLGPDHYVPFAAMAKAGDWSVRKTLTIKVLCGIGHVSGSIILGFLGIALGWAVGSMERFEVLRGDLAAWVLIGFGLAYGIWGLRNALRARGHSHQHVHADGTSRAHQHTHDTDHVHAHELPGRLSVTPWMLFIVFILGPCEPLIPILMVPASQHSWTGVAAVAGVFGTVTILTMCVVVLTMILGVSFVRAGALERWAHALAGFSLVICGSAIKWLGL